MKGDRAVHSARRQSPHHLTMAQNVVVPPFDVAPETVVGSTPQSVFAFQFPFWEKADILVFVNGLKLAEGSFAVEGLFVQNGDPVVGGYGSGRITLNTPVSNITLKIDRRVLASRETAFSRSAPLPMTALNADLNKLTARQQDVERQLRDVEAGVVDPDVLAEVVDEATAGKADKAANLSDLSSATEALENLHFLRPTIEAVARPAYLKMGDRISIRDWLAPGDDDGVTQCAVQFQRALNEISAAGSAGELWIDAPAVGYNIQSPLSYTGQVPIKIIGGTPMSGFPTGPFAQTNILYTGGPAHPGQACFTFQTNGGNNNPLRGVELHNLFIREPSAALSARGSGVCGVMLKGVTRGNIVNVSTYGFARGFDLDDNPANGDSSRVRCANINFYGLCVQNAAEDRVRVAGSAEIIFYSPTLSGTPRPGYRSDMIIQRGARGGRPDHIHAYSGTMIGPAENNLRVETGLFNIFQGVACEGGLNANVYATTDQAPSNDIALTLRDLNIDAAKMYAIDVLGELRVLIDNPRTQQLNTSEGGGTVPAIRIRGHASTANVQLGTEVRGGVITYTGPAGVAIENAALVSVLGGTYRDRDQTSAPCVQTGVGTTRCDVVLPKLIGSTGAADLTGGTEHTRLDNSGLSIRGGPWERNLPVITGTLDGSGVATPAHGVGSAAKITEARAFSINGSGARVPLAIDYWDGSGVRLNGGAGAASRPFELYVTRIP